MSWYPVPFVVESQKCFCCRPASPITVESEIDVTNSGNSDAVTPLRVRDRELVPQFEKICLNNVPPDQSRGYLTRDKNSQTFLDTESDMPRNEYLSMLMPTPSIEPDSGQQLQDPNLALNFHFLQNRQLSGKPARGMHNDGKPSLSSSAPAETIDFGDEISQTRGLDTAMSLTDAGTTDSMDLDSALDELGMLSTVTKSRHQYIREMRSQHASKKREQRLRCKSESSPNLTTVGRPNGYTIVQLDTNFVTGMSSLSDDTPLKSQPLRLEYRNPETLEASASAHRRRSVPRMSRMRKDRYRRSRCPYKIPNRLCNSMQESDFGSEFIDPCDSSFIPSSNSESEETSLFKKRLAGKHHLTTESKSNSSSPAKPSHEVRLVRSLSAEDLIPVRRRLEQELESQTLESSQTDASLDLMASQLTNLHMS